MKHFCPVPVRREKAVVSILQFLGFRAELPCVKSAVSRQTAVRRAKAKKPPETLVPLMAGYVVVSFQGGKPLLWHQLVDVGLVRRGRSLEITEADIQRMLARHDQLNASLAPRQWRPGDTAKISGGLMDGKPIIVREVRGERVMAICEARSVSVKISQLEAA